MNAAFGFFDRRNAAKEGKGVGSSFVEKPTGAPGARASRPYFGLKASGTPALLALRAYLLLASIVSDIDLGKRRPVCDNTRLERWSPGPPGDSGETRPRQGMTFDGVVRPPTNRQRRRATSDDACRRSAT